MPAAAFHDDRSRNENVDPHLPRTGSGVASITRMSPRNLLLACLAAVLIGMANARGHFFVPALGSVVLNVIMIASVLFLAPLMGATLERQIFGLAIGVVFAGLAQALFQVPSLQREGYQYQWAWLENRRRPGGWPGPRRQCCQTPS